MVLPSSGVSSGFLAGGAGAGAGVEGPWGNKLSEIEQA
jgi:hypothetical protein